MKTYVIKHYDELPSTNTLVKETYQNLRDHTLVLADYQTMGRGRRDNKWVSAKGKNFLGTFYKVSEKHVPFRFLLEASVALLKALEYYGIKASIKPPNDLYFKDRKLAGILIEVLHLKRLHVISGIGLNIKSCFDGSTISMEEGLGKKISVSEVVSRIKEAYETAETQTNQALFQHYIAHIDFRYIHVIEAGQSRPLQSINEAFECKVDGVWKACESMQFTYGPPKENVRTKTMK